MRRRFHSNQRQKNPICWLPSAPIPALRADRPTVPGLAGRVGIVAAQKSLPHKWRGMSLVEVLVTLVSTSVGLLGIAALQLVSVRSNQEAHARLQATALTASILDGMRVNRAGVANGEYRNISFNSSGNVDLRSGADLAWWQNEIDRTLPGGPVAAAGAIEQPPNSNIVVVTVRWGRRADDAKVGARTSILQTRVEL